MDLDRYYTPAAVAAAVVESAGVGRGTASVVVDTACGGGSLLLAAQDILGKVACIGNDADRNAIRRLRASHPDWTLSVADLLDKSSFQKTRVMREAAGCDLLTLNPPFSRSRAKRVAVRFHDDDTSCSVAMAHILTSLCGFSPTQGAVAIVPESLLYSEIDEEARVLLGRRYSMSVVRELSNSTFQGARANAAIVRWVPNVTKSKGRTVAEDEALTQRVTRGGLPLFEAKGSREGLPLLHSTDIARVVASGSIESCRRVAPIKRGNVDGLVVLLPRVGVPQKQNLRPILLAETVQLSDCVFAIHFGSMTGAMRFVSAVRAAWSDLVLQYRGTGARYISVGRLERWIGKLRY